MPKHTKIEDEIRRLHQLSPDTLSPYTVRLPPAMALEAAHFAREKNYQMARGLLAIFESYLKASQSGVVLEFDGDIRRQLDLIGTALGLSRAAVVQRIIGENLVKYLQQAVAMQAERREIERVYHDHLRAMVEESESPPAPVKPPRKRKS